MSENLKKEIEEILREFDNKFPETRPIVVSIWKREEKERIKSFLRQSLTRLIEAREEELRGKIEQKLILHTHNSIPSYDADYKNNCRLCIENRLIMEVLSFFTPPKENG